MKVILVGCPHSQRIVPASKYLTAKYLPAYFKTIYLNYGGEINGWSNWVADYLEKLNDEKIIFALDDYLIADTLLKFNYESAWAILELNKRGEDYRNTPCVKLCESTVQEHIEYPVTTQYTLWNREYLISLLRKVSTPWDFEIKGSVIFQLEGKQSIQRPCLNYFTNSSISSRWEGVRLDGLKEEDLDFIKANHLIDE